MSQIEIYEWFKKQRLTGNHQFFSQRDVEKAFDNDNASIRQQVIKLYAWGYLDIRKKSVFKREFRLKNKYVIKVGEPVSPFRRDTRRE